MELLLEGKVGFDDIDDWVDTWHEAKGETCDLSEFLGLTTEEYARWVAFPKALEAIVDERQTKLLHAENIPRTYCGRWWKKGDLYRPDPRDDKELRLNSPFRFWLWLTGWRSSHWGAPHRKWQKLQCIKK